MIDHHRFCLTGRNCSTAAARHTARPALTAVLAVACAYVLGAPLLWAQSAADSGASDPLVTPGATGTPDDADSSTIVYGEEFFSQYNVTTVEDILRRIPGVSAILDGSGGGGGGGQGGNDRRGFGSDGDQVLINGRRLAGKSNEISSALRRIQIQNLDRVELLRGTTSDIDVRSDGVVVNLILREGAAASSSGSAMLAPQLDEEGLVDLDGALTYNGEAGQFTYFVGLERLTVSENGMGVYTRRVRDERIYYPTGEVMAVRLVDGETDFEEYSLTANSTYHFDRGDKLQLNALIKPSTEDSLDVAPFTEFDLDGTPGISGIDLRRELIDSKLEWELGGTYERRIGENGNFKILSVYTHDETSKSESRDEQIDNALYEIGRNTSDELQTEAIVRGSYYWPLTANQSIEIGAESARNTLGQTIAVSADLDGDGIAEPINIFNPSSHVEEIRTEIFFNHNWTMSERWTASSSLIAEKSTITQSGSDINNETDFDFLKPRVDLRFAQNASNQWRIKLEKTVSQLNFGNFVPRFNIREDRFFAGNPDLRPEVAWEYEIGFEHRLDDDEGVIEARIFYQDIDDRIEGVAIDLDNDGELDPASGNIGEATAYGYEVSFSVRMARLGAPDLILDGRHMSRDTSVTDPFTGIERIMAQTWKSRTELGIRHDLADWNLSYGASYDQWGGDNLRSDWTEFRHFFRDPEYQAFIEKRFGATWTLRFDAFDIAKGSRNRTRDIYADGATDGSLSRFEEYYETRDRRYTISVTAAF